MKTYVTTILTISLFFVISCQKGKQEKSPEPGITEWQPAYLALGENITEQERLSFCFKNEEKPVPPLNRIYPEHFGGIYMCPSDRTKTVICLTDTSEQAKQHIIDLCQLSREGYVFQKCEFSKNEMLQIMKRLNDIPNLYEEWGIIDISIFTRKNKVDIHFYGQYDEDPLKVGQAVFISKQVAGTVTVKGKVSAQEVVTFGKPDSASWAQVVNVYPKACSVNDLTWDGMSAGDTLYIYDSSSGTYLPQRQWATIGDKTGWFNVADGSFDSQVIPIGQALFINKATGVASVQVKAE